MMFPNLHAHGKILLTGEYLVLDGGVGLAVPTRLGQSFQATAVPEELGWTWESYTAAGELWFTMQVDGKGQLLTTSDEKAAEWMLVMVTHIATERQISFNGHKFESRLAFPRDWGLGSSSTLVAALAEWGGVSPYRLLSLAMGGSGYDLYAAFAKSAYLFQKIEGQPTIQDLSYSPSFTENMAFVHLGVKQNSRQAIAAYRSRKKTDAEFQRVETLTRAWITASSPSELMDVINEHEAILQNILQEVPVKERLFPDFSGAIKSLGAWGGDFVLAVSEGNSIQETTRWFNEKGYPTVLSWDDMVWSPFK